MGAKPKKNGSISYAKWGYIFIAPFFLIFAVFQLIPLGSTIYYSFFEYYRSGLKIIGPTFVGLKNYITLFATDLPKYFGNTLLLWIIGFIPQIAISPVSESSSVLFKISAPFSESCVMPSSPPPQPESELTPRNSASHRASPFFFILISSSSAS